MNLYKISNYTKRAFSIFMIFFQMRLTGYVGNICNYNGVKNYHEIVKDFARLLEEEDISDLQNIYEYYNYAMWNGYFSEDKNLKYSINRDLYIDNAGMGIMSGSSVCLNYADMLSLVFEELGYNSYVTMCYVTPDNTKIESIRTDKNIERKIDETGLSLFDNIVVKNISKIFGNHAITCVEKGNDLYFFDPTNFAYLTKNGINNLSIVNGDGKFDLKYISSLLFENINIFKIANYQNANDYKEIILEKEEININIEKLEEFYNNHKTNINIVKKTNDRNILILSLVIYSTIVSIMLMLIQEFINNKVSKHEHADMLKLFPKIKEYFQEKNIIKELEIIKNYELIESKFGIKDNLGKDIYKKSISAFLTLTKNRNVKHIMIMLCLNHLGYNSRLIYAKKINGIFKRNLVLIEYTDNLNNSYIFDYELGELLYRNEKKELCSLDGKYTYKCENIIYDDYHTKEEIQKKMNEESSILSNEEIKSLKKNKTLRL